MKKLNLIKSKEDLKVKIVAASAAAGSMMMQPAMAFADVSSSDVNSTFHDVCNVIAMGLIVFGGIYLIWGIVQVGQGINGDGGGQDLKTGFKHLAGGLIIAAAGGILLAFTQMVNI